jgi:uncharacterized RDD family membrane protein YckC
MTQTPEHPEQQGSPGASQPPSQPYASAPPVAEPYGAATQGGSEYAGRGKRLVAAILDFIILSVISTAVTTPMFGSNAMFNKDATMGDKLGQTAVTIVLAVIYFTFQHAVSGQSIGKRAAGIRVVLADGGRLSYGTAAIRVLFTYLFTYITFSIGGLIDSLFIFSGDRKQCLHDKVAKTVVIPASAANPYKS